MAHSTNYFPNTSNAVFNNTRITHVSGSAHFGSSERHGLRLLLDNISQGAFHDAAERGDPPKCHPDTRIAIREEIMEWIQAPEAQRKLILWMYGPAGSGKTAIAQSIAEECKKRGLLAASFFFARTVSRRNDTTRVVATIAYQISRFIPQIENDLFTAIERDPTIFSRALSTQMQVLVVEPLNSVQKALAGPIFVILDGLDESGPSAQSQAYLLNAIETAISELQHISLIFLIASRPDYEIREAFSQPLLHSFMRPLELNNNYNPDADIKLYFNSTFRQIHDKHFRQGIHLPSAWPSNSDVDWLVSKASGQFIFAATVLRFIGSIQHHPVERLNIVVGLSVAGNETPFALLDALYHYILSSVANRPQVLEILTLLLLAPTRNIGNASPLPDLTVGMISDLLEIDVRRALVDMHALIFVPLPTDESSVVRLHHASLHDFLLDQSRSRDCYIDVPQGHITLSRRWLKAIGSQKISESSKLYFPSCIECFVVHCLKSPVSSEIADDLARFNLKALLEEMYGDIAQDIYKTNWERFFDCVKKQIKVQRRKFYVGSKKQLGEGAGILTHLQGEFIAFFIERISKYPLPLRDYVPTILAHSTVSGHYGLFHISLHAVCQSQKEFNEGLKLDSTLLNLFNTHWTNGIFSQLFKDRSLAGHYYIHGGSYSALAKQVAPVIFIKPAEFYQKGRFRQGTHEIGGHSIKFPYGFWLGPILKDASTDFDVALFLLKHALQYRDDVGRSFTTTMGDIARSSLQYVQRCGLPYLKHTHLEGTNECIICHEYGAASVVVGIHIPSSQPYSNNAFDKLRFSVCNRLRDFKSARLTVMVQVVASIRSTSTLSQP